MSAKTMLLILALEYAKIHRGISLVHARQDKIRSMAIA